MTDTMKTTVANGPSDPSKWYKEVALMAAKRGIVAQRKVVAHLRAVTMNESVNLPVYNCDESISDESKCIQYRLILHALSHDDYSKLLGKLGNGDSGGKGEATQPTTTEPPETKQASEETPAKENVPPQTQGVNTKGEKDDTLRKLAEVLRDLGLGKSEAPAAAETDYVRVREIADEQFHYHINNGGFPENRVTQLVSKALEGHVKRIELVTPTGEVKTVEGLVHCQFPDVLKMVRSRTTNGYSVPVWLDGPPGSGKTHMMQQVAEALGVEAYILAIGPTDTKSVIVGTMSTGKYIPGIARQWYEHGGLLGIDEIAAGDPGVLNSTNTLIANTLYRFPDGTLVKKHKDAYIIVADNTRGKGSTKGFIRNKLDAATLDRPAFTTINYDKDLEVALSGNKKWAEWVQKVREFCGKTFSESVYVSPRASINGAALLAGGLGNEFVADATVFKLFSADQKATTIANVGAFK